MASPRRNTAPVGHKRNFRTSLSSIVALIVRADMWTPLAQLTCIPEHGYFKLETVNLQGESAHESTLRDGFHSAGMLFRNPFACRFPEDTVTVEGKYYSETRGACGLKKGT